MTVNPTWSEDRITLLARLWLDGLSASQIAKHLGGVTRNAVIGKIHRLGLSGRAAPVRIAPAKIARSPRCRALPPAKSARAIPPDAQGLYPTEGPGLVASLTALGAHSCKWPIGDPKAPDFSYCGRLAGGPYCAKHHDLAYRPGVVRRTERGRESARRLA